MYGVSHREEGWCVCTCSMDVWLPAAPPPAYLHCSMHRAADNSFGGITVRLRKAWGLREVRRL